MTIGGIAAFSFLFLATVQVTPAAASVTVSPAQGKPAPPLRVDEPEARRIAWEYGLIHVEEIALEGSRWEIAGRDDEDGEIVLDIDAHTGAVSR